MTDTTAVQFRQADGSLWERSGTCSRCGQCCLGCPLLRLQALNITRCAHYGGWRYRQGCDRWPSKPEHGWANPRCSYRWRRVEG